AMVAVFCLVPPRVDEKQPTLWSRKNAPGLGVTIVGYLSRQQPDSRQQPVVTMSVRCVVPVRRMLGRTRWPARPHRNLSGNSALPDSLFPGGPVAAVVNR